MEQAQSQKLSNTKNNSPESSEFEFLDVKGNQVEEENVVQPPKPLPDLSQLEIKDPQPQIIETSKTVTEEKSTHSTIPQQTPTPSAKVTIPVDNENLDEGGGLIGWMRGASGGLLTKVAQTTKSSVESMITTLDPQMKEIIHSGGDLEIIVVSDKPSKVRPIRQAFQEVFGLATVNGVKNPGTKSVAEQPVGFAAGRQGANERIQMARSKKMVSSDMTLIGIEGFLLEVGVDSWVEISCIMLSDPLNDINLTTFTQPTPVDTSFVEIAKSRTPENYPKRWSGLSTTIGSVISESWNIPHTEWHETVCGVKRETFIKLGAEVLAGMYKRTLANRSS